MLALACVSSGVLVAWRLKELDLPGTGRTRSCSARAPRRDRRRATSSRSTVDVKGDLLGSLLSGTGLVCYGGAIGGALAVMAYARGPRLPRDRAVRHGRARRWPSATRSGASAASSPGDGDYGIPVGPAVGDELSRRHGPTTDRGPPDADLRVPRHGRCRRWWLWSRRDKVRPGALIGWWPLLAGIERFLVEFIRRNEDIVGPVQPRAVRVRGDDRAGAWWLLRLRSREPRLRARRRVPSARSSARRKARPAAASSSTPTPTDL